MPIIYKPRTRLNATDGIQSTIAVADPPSGYGGQPHTMASQHYQSHSCVPVVCTGFAQGTKKSKQQSHTCAPVVCTGFVQGTKNQNNRAILARLWFAQGLYKAPKIKTTEPFLRACGLHRVCTGFAQGAKNQNSRAILARLWFAQGLSKAPKNKIADQFTLLPASFARPTCIWR